MKDCDSRPWIDEEILSSRDQVKEEERTEATQVGFSKRKPQVSIASYQDFHIGFAYVCYIMCLFVVH
jgi:hypothetical protein